MEARHKIRLLVNNTVATLSGIWTRTVSHYETSQKHKIWMKFITTAVWPGDVFNYTEGLNDFTSYLIWLCQQY